jgi:hypothetical protein
MSRFIFCLLWILSFNLFLAASGQNVLIIQDEKPQMEVLTEFLQKKSELQIEIVDQKQLPEKFSIYQAVIVYIHRVLEPETETKIIEYTRNGGRLVLLHHSISSGKAKNEHYFSFLGIRLDNPKGAKNPVIPGGDYGYADPISYTLINLNPNHYITTHEIEWPEKVLYSSSDSPAVELEYPAMTLDSAEVYLNHKFIDGQEKTILCGFKFLDQRNGQLFMQDRLAWIKQQGRGQIIFFQPGHSSKEFENPLIAQFVLNAINWKP